MKHLTGQLEIDSKSVASDKHKERGVFWVEGQWYAIVCVGPIYYGRLRYWDAGHYVLEEASWIPDAGRIHAFVEDPSNCGESEYVGEVCVERSSVQGTYRIQKGGKVVTK